MDQSPRHPFGSPGSPFRTPKKLQRQDSVRIHADYVRLFTYLCLRLSNELCVVTLVDKVGLVGLAFYAVANDYVRGQKVCEQRCIDRYVYEYIYQL
jgi:hypothetical protein